MVPIGLLLKYLYDNITNKQFPNHFIRVSKQDLLTIKGIHFKYDNIRTINLTNSLIDLSKLEYLCKINFIYLVFNLINVQYIYNYYYFFIFIRCNQLHGSIR